jgi:hypothetical protein
MGRPLCLPNRSHEGCRDVAHSPRVRLGGIWLCPGASGKSGVVPSKPGARCSRQVVPVRTQGHIPFRATEIHSPSFPRGGLR